MDKKANHTLHSYKGHKIVKIISYGMEVYKVKDMPDGFYKKYWDGEFNTLKEAKKFIDEWENETMTDIKASSSGDFTLQSILASKLYRASSRKERIHAAMLSPGNSPLVQQLADSLDEEYQTPKNLGQSEKEKEAPKAEDDLMVDEEINPETDLVSVDDYESDDKGKIRARHKSAPAPKGAPPKGPEEKEKSDTSELMPDSPMTEEKPEKPEAKEEAEASTKVTATTEVRVDPVPGEAIDLNVLKATLNSREDTAGVSRIAEKENEVWIYYKDEVNLNTIMTDVIEFLMNTSEYKSFTFNRLARSDNAIVFVIGLESYQYPEKSVEPLEVEE